MHCRYDAGARSWRYCLGAVGDGDAGVAVGELVVAGAWDSTVSLRGQSAAATTITTTSTAIAYKKRLSPKKFIITSRNRPSPNNNGDIGGEFGVRSMVPRVPSGIWLDRGSPGPNNPLFVSRGRQCGEFATSVTVRSKPTANGLRGTTP